MRSAWLSWLVPYIHVVVDESHSQQRCQLRTTRLAPAASMVGYTLHSGLAHVFSAFVCNE